ncbi:MAG: DNA recombination protein RmuC, partial [Hoeflea sp.]
IGSSLTDQTRATHEILARLQERLAAIDTAQSNIQSLAREVVGLQAIVQRAHRARVVIVSPSLLMLSIQVIQAILKDARMREQAHLIQGEVVRLMEDLSRLDDRTRKLQAHFSMAQKDVDLILTSSEKLAKRGSRIESLEFAQLSEQSGNSADGKPASPPKARDDTDEAGESLPFESRTGALKLRVVDEDD